MNKPASQSESFTPHSPLSRKVNQISLIELINAEKQQQQLLGVIRGIGSIRQIFYELGT
jgi:hypothetical protein